MLVHSAIADEFPLLAAIAHELSEADGGNEVTHLRTARRMLRDAFRSLDGTPDLVVAVPSTNGRRRWSGPRRREVMQGTGRKAKAQAVQG